METKTALIFGSGHLADRVKKLVIARKYSVTHIPFLQSIIAPDPLSVIEEIAQVMLSTDLSLLSIIYILDDKDELNLEILMALISLLPKTKICMSLFNENMRPHLMAAHPQLHIINPAEKAAPFFVGALYLPMVETLSSKNNIFKSINPPT